MALEIEEWEIWHTYTTYLESTHIDLQESARRLITSGVAECAMLRDGRTYWRSDNGAQSGSTSIEIDSDGTSTLELKLDEGSSERPTGFILEAWGQAAYFLTSEHRVLGSDTALPCPYLRAYLGKCVLTSTTSDKTSSEINLYPVLTVYESGVLIVEFRMIGPKTTTSLPDFITGGVNLFTWKFDRVQVSPGLSAFATRAYYQSAHRVALLPQAPDRLASMGP